MAKLNSCQCFSKLVPNSKYTSIISIQLIFVEIWLPVHHNFQVSQWTGSHILTNMAAIEIILFSREARGFPITCDSGFQNNCFNRDYILQDMDTGSPQFHHDFENHGEPVAIS
jgi:hypothetical protein